MSSDGWGIGRSLARQRKQLRQAATLRRTGYSIQEQPLLNLLERLVIQRKEPDSRSPRGFRPGYLANQSEVFAIEFQIECQRSLNLQGKDSLNPDAIF